MNAHKIALAGGAIGVLSLALPWITVSSGIFTRSITGVSGDPLIIALVSGVAALFALVGKDSLKTRFVYAGASILNSIMVIVLLARMVPMLDGADGVTASLDIGFVAGIASAALLILAALKEPDPAPATA